MAAALAHHGCGTSARLCAPVRSSSLHRLSRQQAWRTSVPHTACAVLERVSLAPQQITDAKNSIVPAPNLFSSTKSEEVAERPQLYVTLAEDVASISGAEACIAGLKALKKSGVTGVVVDVWWGAVEADVPQQYHWEGYQRIVHAAHDAGLKVKADIHFHAGSTYSLPTWVRELGQQMPDLFFSDRTGTRYTSCLGLGVDQARVLAGRTGLEVYGGLITSFRQHFAPFMGSTITECTVGLGPGGELRYPSQPDDGRWAYPGVGEFQCYDSFMLASLRACAHQVSQPVWGLCGPHDAGSYKLWPHQTGFFANHGSWTGGYGRFFLQWYSSLLVGHADAVLGTAAAALRGSGVALSGKLPLIHWWHNQATHAAELTAGIYNTAQREGYLPILQAFARHGAGVRLPGAELRNVDQHQQALCDPEHLMLQIRAAATAVHVPVTLECSSTRLDPATVARLEQGLFEPATCSSISLHQPKQLVVRRMGPELLEPANWQAFRGLVKRVRERQDPVPAAAVATAAEDAAAAGSSLQHPLLQKAQQQVQQQAQQQAQQAPQQQAQQVAQQVTQQAAQQAAQQVAQQVAQQAPPLQQQQQSNKPVYA